MKRTFFFLLVIAGVIFLVGCGKSDPSPACPTTTGTPQYITVPPEALPTPTAGPTLAPVVMEIGGKSITVDKVVEGPLCNDTWSGTVYVTCNIQIYPWQDSPTFLKNCNLAIEPGTVVYVAYHNDTAYYNGCSCHTGEIAEP
jgi:hypothetical protein